MPKVISMQQLKILLQTPPVRIIDIRQPAEYKENKLFATENIPYDTLIRYPDKYLKPNEAVYLICDDGSGSFRCAKILEIQGYTAVSIRYGYIGIGGTGACNKVWK